MSETMTGRERFLAALRREVPDRVPIFELMIHRQVIDRVIPGVSYSDFVETAGLDCAVTPTPSSMYRREVVGEQNGVILYRTEWGETRGQTIELVPFPIQYPVETREDWNHYRVPDPDTPERLKSLRELVQRFRNEKAIGIHLHDAFSYPSYILGFTKLFLSLYEDPEWVQEIIDVCVAHSVQLLRRAAKEGADFVVLGDDYGGKNGPLMSPQHFEKFFLPGLVHIVETAKDAGLYVIKHTDGNIYSILGMIVEAGIDAFHPSDPSAGMDIVKVKQLYGDRICVVGGIDTGPPLSEWSVEAVIAEVRRRIQELAPRGGWIIASSNTIHASVRPENYGAMVWATRAFGQYDSLNKYSPVPELEAHFDFIHHSTKGNTAANDF